MTRVAELTDENFEAQVLRSEFPVFVDFWAPWCAACLARMPMIESAAERFQERVRFGRVDVTADSTERIVLLADVESIPLLRLYQAGGLAAGVEGPVDESKLQQLLDSLAR